jgi:hypothetical protein
MTFYNIISWVLFAVTLLGLCFYALKHYVDMKFNECMKNMDTEYRWLREDIRSIESDMDKANKNTINVKDLIK